MNIQHHAMLCGASFIAMSMAVPLQAQTVPGLDLPPTYVIGATEVIASGVTDEAFPASTAIVNTVPTGTITQLLQAEEAADGALSLTNDGTVGIRASATAVNADGQAISVAEVEDSISQIYTTPSSNLSATFLNNNVLVFDASALATGTTFEGDAAAATSTLIGGVHQEVTVEGGGGGSATVTLTNAESITASSAATAQAEGDVVAGAVLQEAVFMRAQANGAGGKDQVPSITTTTFTNSGTMALSATALGTSTAGDADASAAAGSGEHGLIHVRAAANGRGDDSATVTMTNAADATIGVTTTATANALLGAEANAVGDTAIVVKAQASGADLGLPSATLTNAGAINIAAGSVATSTDADGGAFAETSLNPAIFQIVEAGGPESFVGRSGSATLNNSGSIAVNGTATATSANSAGASSIVGPAVLQEAEITGVAAASFTNSGNFGATSTATASGAFAGAEASSIGVEQELVAVGGATASFTNSGTFAVNATATATGTIGAEGAVAQAAGLAVTGEPLALAVSNTKTFTVGVTATANGATRAEAAGMVFQADYNPFTAPPEGEGGGEGGGEDEEGGNPDNGHNGGGGEGEDEEITWEGVTNAISGTVSNSGTMTVSASSFGNGAGEEVSLLDMSEDRSANVVGIRMLSAVNTATVTNTGTLTVSAISNGSTVDAKGIVLRDFLESPVVPGEGDRFTIINNGGTIIARQSTNGGTNWVRGTAIDTERAPNGGDIRLQGNGSIYGDIKISDADTITVSGGETRFDGVINPYVETMEPVPVEVAAFAAFAPAGPLVGSLSIASGGTLYLVDQPNNNPSYSGPAGANVATFSIASGGTLALQLPTNSDPAIAQAAYPFINAGTANLDGTLELRPSSQNGLYADTYVYADIIDANTRNGSFARVVTDTGSPLLAFSAVNDANANVDLNMTRVGFGSVPGLTVNQAATGNGIENVYAPNLTGPFAGLLGTLFTLDADAYPDALDQLSGDQYAGYLQGLRNYSLQTNTMISDQLDCAISIDGPQKCRARDGEVRVWALGNYNDASVDTDINAPGYSAQNWSVLLGVDYTTGNFTFGAFGGYRDTAMDFTRNAGRIEADGWQFGGFAAYDTGDFYVRAIGSYSGLNGQSTRSVAIGSFAGVITGEPDANVTSLYGEAGARFDVGQTWATPFVALDYTSVGLPSFTETGVPGANLGFADQSQNQTSLLLGLKWAGNFGGIIPEAKVAWRYDLSNELFGVDPYFDDAPAGSTYRVFAPTTNASSVVVGVSLAAALGKQATGRIGYQGRYNGQVNDNAFYGSLTIAFGGAPEPVPAPPPPPVPAPAPLPPCPPAAVTPGPFLVFFDWDKSLITAEAAQILDRAAEQYAATGQTRVEIAGHTDTSGSASYNMELGQRRADAVKAYLATKGVPESATVTQSFGETRLLVETADGVREPQNRRAEITFSGAPAPASGPCTPQ